MLVTPHPTGGRMLLQARDVELRELVRNAPARFDARLQRRARRRAWWKRAWS